MCYYENALFPNSIERVRWAIRTLRNSDIQFEGIACRGYSGIAMASILSYRLKVPLVLIRKPRSEERSHSTTDVDYNRSKFSWQGKNYIIVDDLVDSGNTIADIICKMKKEFSARCTGILLYEPYFGIERTLEQLCDARIRQGIPVILYGAELGETI